MTQEQRSIIFHIIERHSECFDDDFGCDICPFNTDAEYCCDDMEYGAPIIVFLEAVLNAHPDVIKSLTDKEVKTILDLLPKTQLK